jgi:hypothetical protein
MVDPHFDEDVVLELFEDFLPIVVQYESMPTDADKIHNVGFPKALDIHLFYSP